VTLLGREASG